MTLVDGTYVVQDDDGEIVTETRNIPADSDIRAEWKAQGIECMRVRVGKT